MTGRTRTESRLRDGGYAVILSALLLIPLLGFAGFATDLGSWYAQANRQQRAADAAALAGVVWLPDMDRARATALEIAAENGFDDADDEITVTVTRVGAERLRVRIHDARADQFFSSLFLDDVDITRQATAEYVLPVPLGSPENRFGTGTLAMGGTPQNLWAAASGYCNAKEHGDQLLARFDG
ncbi:MAG: pilus assembly protein TadG-related protein, partial [Actinomycetota bacterium]